MRHFTAVLCVFFAACASAPAVDPDDLPSVIPSSAVSTTSLVVTDTCNTAIVISTALLFPFWTPVPLIYGVFTHVTWDNNPEDGTKPVLGLFACFALLPIYAL